VREVLRSIWKRSPSQVRRPYTAYAYFTLSVCLTFVPLGLREKLNSNIPPWLRASIGGQVYPGAFFFLDLNPHLSQQLDDARSDSRTNPGWVEWILQGQPRSSGLPTVQGDSSQRNNPLLLCIDWTGCTPEEHRVQNVLADIVLRQWVGHGRSQGQGATTGVGTIGTLIYVLWWDEPAFLYDHAKHIYIPPENKSATTYITTSLRRTRVPSPGVSLVSPTSPS
jgi:hypothetical protein